MLIILFRPVFISLPPQLKFENEQEIYLGKFSRFARKKLPPQVKTSANAPAC